MSNIKGSYVFSTEDDTWFLSSDNIYRHNCYVFLKPNNRGVLCVQMSERNTDSAPDAILVPYGSSKSVEELMILSYRFQNPEDAFAAMDENTKMADEMMTALVEEMNATVTDDEDSHQNFASVSDTSAVPPVPKPIAYEYLFNYFGDATYHGKKVVGLSLQIAFHVFKDGKEVKFLEEPITKVELPSRISEKPQVKRYYLFDMLDVSFHQKQLCCLKRNPYVYDILRLQEQWDKIEANVIGYEFVLMEKPCVGYSVPVDDATWLGFCMEHAAELDILDNQKAQVPTYLFVEEK